jgi:hypothetical protein
MECITAKNEPKKATLFFETAIKQGNKGDENQLSTSKNTPSFFIKTQNLKRSV